MRDRAGVMLALLIAVGVGTWLRFYGLGQRDFWFDESCTFIYVDSLLRWPSLTSLLKESTNLPYYVILRGWVSLFGDSEAAYRSLSAFCAALTLPVFGWIAWRLAGVRALLVCAALAAFHPLHIYYAHEARAYAMWVLVLATCMALLIEAVRRGRRHWWIAYGVAIWFCLHLHYFTLFWVPVALICAWVTAPFSGSGSKTGIKLSKDVLRRSIVAHAIVLAAFVPYLVFAVLPAGRGGGSSWIAAHFDAWSAIPRSIWCMLPAGAYPGHLRGLSLASPDTASLQWLMPARLAQVLPALVVALLLFVVVRRRRRSNDLQMHTAPAGAHAFLAAMTFGPLAFAWAYSILVRPVYLPGRYDLVALPAFVVWTALLVVHGSSRLAARRSRGATAIVTILLCACSCIPIARFLSQEPPPSLHRKRAERLAKLANQGDLAIAFSYDRDYLLYYLHRSGFQGNIASFPSWLDTQVGWVDTDADFAALQRSMISDDVDKTMNSIGGVLKRGGRVFLLGDSIDPTGNGPRTAINNELLECVRLVPLDLIPLDVQLGVFELR